MNGKIGRNLSMSLRGAPWKLVGLPGVVLEAEDATGEVRFSFAEVVEFASDEHFSIRLPEKLSAFPLEKLPLLKRLFGETASNFVNESGVLYVPGGRAEGPEGFPFEGIDGLWVTNPMELE